MALAILRDLLSFGEFETDGAISYRIVLVNQSFAAKSSSLPLPFDTLEIRTLPPAFSVNREANVFGP